MDDGEMRALHSWHYIMEKCRLHGTLGVGVGKTTSITVHETASHFGTFIGLHIIDTTAN
jgi:hypothetical protein